MSDFFRAFNIKIGQKQKATMAYRPQANGTAERMVQTVTRAMKMYVSDVNQQDWDEYAERLTFAINTARDRVRGDTPFYLIHGWGPSIHTRSDVTTGENETGDRETRRWRYHIQRLYQRAREAVNEKLGSTFQARADRHNADLQPYQIEPGVQVWLYLDRMKKG